MLVSAEHDGLVAARGANLTHRPRSTLAALFCQHLTADSLENSKDIESFEKLVKNPISKDLDFNFGLKSAGEHAGN